jgi:hypothetical protein
MAKQLQLWLEKISDNEWAPIPRIETSQLKVRCKEENSGFQDNEFRLKIKGIEGHPTHRSWYVEWNFGYEGYKNDGKTDYCENNGAINYSKTIHLSKSVDKHFVDGASLKFCLHKKKWLAFVNVAGEVNVPFDCFNSHNTHEDKASLNYKGIIITINYVISIKKQTNPYQMLDVYKFGKEVIIPSYNAKTHREHARQMVEDSEIGGEARTIAPAKPAPAKPAPAKPAKPADQSKAKPAPQPSKSEPKNNGGPPYNVNFEPMTLKEYNSLGQALTKDNFKSKMKAPLTSDDVQNYELAVKCVNYAKAIEEKSEVNPSYRGFLSIGNEYGQNGDFQSGKRIRNMANEIAVWSGQIMRALKNDQISPKDYLGMIQLNVVKNKLLKDFFKDVGWAKGEKFCSDRHAMFVDEMNTFEQGVKQMSG